MVRRRAASGGGSRFSLSPSGDGDIEEGFTRVASKRCRGHDGAWRPDGPRSLADIMEAPRRNVEHILEHSAMHDLRACEDLLHVAAVDIVVTETYAGCGTFSSTCKQLHDLVQDILQVPPERRGSFTKWASWDNSPVAVNVLENGGDIADRPMHIFTDKPRPALR